MRRILIFLLSLTIPVGFLIGAVRVITPMRDDATMTVEHIYGDVSRVEGRQLRQTVKCGEHMLWETIYTAGVNDSIHTDYTFSQSRMEHEFDWDTENVMFSVDGGSGMGTSGSDGIQLAYDGVGILLRAVADRTAAGETRTETVKLEDYLTSYPLDYDTNIETASYMIWESYDSYHSLSGRRGYLEWEERFRFPLLPGAEMEISLTKNSAGKVCDVYYSMTDCPEIGFATHVLEDGMYFAPFFLDWQGNPVTTGEYICGNGVYYVPFKAMFQTASYYNSQTETNMYEGTFDFDNLKLVYGMEMDDRVVAMEASGDGSGLHLLTMEEGTYYYATLDLITGEVTYREEIMPSKITSVSEESYAAFPEENVMILYSGKDVAVIRTGENPGVAFTCDFPEDIYMNHPRSVLLEDGQLFMTGYSSGDAYIAVCDENGLGYFGQYRNSLLDVPPSYSSSFIYEEELEFVK